ncbi:ABC transporter permease [Peribacillus kribbensis]|uniref:ABC transporter permease n=1 Tax=Peribacillus kribbensis TaxID=356658 RepID=UPI000403AAB2|nr:ABC transporter permease subunit [Peribacillus kribbensis]
MISLICNELMKIFQKKSSWIYMIIIVLAVAASAIIYQKVTPDDKNWKENLTAENAGLKQDLENQNGKTKELTETQIKQNEMYIKDDINPNAVTNWTYMNTVLTGVLALVTLLSVIVSSASVSAEFSDGTIKQLLIRPHPRWAVLLSKYIALLIYYVLLLAVLIAAGFIMGTLLFGYGDFGAKIFDLGLNGVKETTVGAQFFLKILYYIPGLIVITAIAFMLSTLFKSQALAVGIGIFVLFLSSTLGGLIVMLADKYAWAKYILFPHLDLTIYAVQDKILGNITLPISLGVLLVYYLIFMAITFVFFQKRDISI